MLPADFQWIPRGQYAGDELALTVGGRWVAQLMKKIAGIEAWACRNEDALRAGRHLYVQAEPEDD